VSNSNPNDHSIPQITRTESILPDIYVADGAYISSHNNINYDSFIKYTIDGGINNGPSSVSHYNTNNSNLFNHTKDNDNNITSITTATSTSTTSTGNTTNGGGVNNKILGRSRSNTLNNRNLPNPNPNLVSFNQLQSPSNVTTTTTTNTP